MKIKSNHPDIIKKQNPISVQTNISNPSMTETIFREASAPYQTALNSAGYSPQLVYAPVPTIGGMKSRTNKKT